MEESEEEELPVEHPVEGSQEDETGAEGEGAGAEEEPPPEEPPAEESEEKDDE